MSQEINLFNPALRPKTDWLAFRPVAALTLALVALVVVAWAWVAWQTQAATQERIAGEARLRAAQQSLSEAQATLAGHRPSPQLAAEIDRLTTDLARRHHVLQRVRETVVDGNGGLSDVMRGFSRQIMEGVWLTGFSSDGKGIDIRGRLLDPGLLPAYIRRLNNEPAFRGRRFATLDMQDGKAAAATNGAAPAAASMPAEEGALPPFIEFALRARAVPANGSKE